MTEASLKSDLMALLRAELPGFVVFRIEDKITGGIPDVVVTGNKSTTWWEVKFANPDFKCPGIQELTALRLAAAGKACFFIVYALRRKERSVHIVHPKNLNEWMRAEVTANGFNHRFVMEFIRGVHS